MDRWILCLGLLLASTVSRADEEARTLSGWTVRIQPDFLRTNTAVVEHAVKVIAGQLEAVVRSVPPAALVELRKVPLWISPEYPGFGAMAEYHPNVDWLREHGRKPELAKAVEFTNVRIIDDEVRRMPFFVLHELAHAFHDRVLGFDHERMRQAFETAKASGRYEKLEVRDARGNTSIGRSYAITNPQEYFAEGTEAFFGQNDWFPYNRVQLREHDPKLFDLLRELWGDQVAPVIEEVRPPPLAMGIPVFHQKYLEARGFPIVASARVSDFALKEAAFLINMMLAERPDVREAMIGGGSRLCIVGYNEYTTDLPEFAWLGERPEREFPEISGKDFWDARARGTGGSETDPYCSCGEENLLGYPGDPYAKENILIHEFAHHIHLRGVNKVDPKFDERVKQAYKAAGQKGLWAGKYASVNHHEYFAEGVQSWFDNNRENDHDHNHVDTRAELLEYDPALAALCREVFGETVLKYTKPATRLEGHLGGYDPGQAPTFVWPERLQAAKRAIREAAEERSKASGAAAGAP